MTPPAIGGTKPISLSPAAERAQQQAQKLHEAAQQFEGMLISTLWKFDGERPADRIAGYRPRRRDVERTRVTSDVRPPWPPPAASASPP